MASYEALYGRRCRMPIFWFELSKEEGDQARVDSGSLKCGKIDEG